MTTAGKVHSKESKGSQKVKSVVAKTRERAAELAVNIVDFQKTTFDNTAKVVGSIQDQTEKMLLEIVSRSSWMPKEAKTVVHEWIRMAKRSRADFTKTMDKSFDLIGDYIKRLEESEAHAKGNGKHTAATAHKKPAKRAARPAKAA